MSEISLPVELTLRRDRIYSDLERALARTCVDGVAFQIRLAVERAILIELECDREAHKP